MPDRSVSRFRRLGLGRGAGSRSWVPRTWVGRASALVTRVSRGRRVLSLVISALIVLATGLVTVAVLPATAAPASTDITAPAPMAVPTGVLPDVTVHSTTAPMVNLTPH